MKKVVKENQVFQKEVISRADAMKMAESGELGALGPAVSLPASRLTC